MGINKPIDFYLLFLFQKEKVGKKKTLKYTK